jgi:hypothetical protein
MMHDLKYALLALVPGLLVLAGCSSSGESGSGPDGAAQSTMQEVADLLRAASHPGGRGPGKLAELDKVKGMYSHGYDAIKSGDIVVCWGYGVQGEGAIAKGGGEVVAYEKDAPANGGFVLLASGQVKKLSASEFNSAPKAGKR